MSTNPFLANLFSGPKPQTGLHEGCERKGGVCDCAGRPCALDHPIQCTPHSVAPARKKGSRTLDDIARELETPDETGLSPKQRRELAMERYRAQRPAKLAIARAILAEKGVKVGSSVRVVWGVYKEFGGGTMTHKGVVTRLDEMIVVKPFQDRRGVLTLSITSDVTVDLIDTPSVPESEEDPSA